MKGNKQQQGIQVSRGTVPFSTILEITSRLVLEETHKIF